MPQSWQREQTGILGLEQDVRALYVFVNGEISHVKTFILDEFSKIRKMMADYTQAAADAAGALDNLSTKVQELATDLKNAVAANDMSAVQAVADNLEQHVQNANAVLQGLDTPPAGTVTADAPPNPGDSTPPNAGTGDSSVGNAPAGSDTTLPADPPATPADTSSATPDPAAPQDPANS
jgi:hypothetical protein